MENGDGLPQGAFVPEAAEPAVSPETEAKGKESPFVRVEWLESLINTGLNEQYDRDKTPENERQRIELWVLRQSELLKGSAEDFFGKLRDSKVATYFGGIGMGIAGNQSEYLIPEGKGGDARVAIGDEWQQAEAEVLRKLGKLERGMPADFLGQEAIGKEVVFTLMPRTEVKGVRSSLRSDMIAHKYMAEMLKESGAEWEGWYWSNSAFKKSVMDRAAKAMLDWGNRMGIRAGKLTADSSREEVKAEYERLRMTAPSWQQENSSLFKDPLEAFEYMQAHEGVDFYMGGAPDGRESLTFPIVGASEKLLSLALKRLVLKGQRWGVRKLGEWQYSSVFVKTLLAGKPLPDSWRVRAERIATKMGLDPSEGTFAMVYKMMNEGLPGDMTMLLSRLAEMGEYDPWMESDLFYQGESGSLTERVFGELRGDAVTTLLVDQTGQVVDTSRGVARTARYLWGEENTLVLVTDPDVPFVNAKGQRVWSDMGHTAIKELVADMRSWREVKRLQQQGVILLVDRDLEPGEERLESHLRPAVRPVKADEAIKNEYHGMQAYWLYAVDQQKIMQLKKWRDEAKVLKEQGSEVMGNEELGVEPVDYETVNQALRVFDIENAKFSKVQKDYLEGVDVDDAFVGTIFMAMNRLRDQLQGTPLQPASYSYSAQVVR